MATTIPRKMRAAVLCGWNDLRYMETNTPEFGQKEALCRVTACGICGTDPHILKGDFKGVFPPSFPFVMGHEWFGEVVALGDKVQGFSIGELVVAEPQNGCGSCKFCREGRYHLCMAAPRPDKGYKLYGHNVNGAYAEYIAVDALSLHNMPDSLGLEEGVSACNVGIGVNGVRRGRIGAGDRVAVVGAGLLGLIVLQLAKVMGASRTVAVDVNPHRLAIAADLGADSTLEPGRCDVVHEVKSLTDGEGADVVFECSGAEGSLQHSLDCTRRGGRLVLMGMREAPTSLQVTNRVTLDEIEIVGARGSPNAMAQSLRFLSAGRVNVRPLVTHRIPLSEVNRGMEIFTRQEDNAIRVALIP